MAKNKKKSLKSPKKKKQQTPKKKVLKKPAAKKKPPAKKTLPKKIKKAKAKKPKAKKKPLVKKAPSKKAPPKKTPPPPQKALPKKAPPKKEKTSSFLQQMERELAHLLEKKKKVSIRNPDGFEYCLEEDCDQSATTGGWCRLHYMASWAMIKEKNQILNENKIPSWIQQFVQDHSISLLHLMIRDFSNEKDFAAALSEMKISSKNKRELE